MASLQTIILDKENVFESVTVRKLNGKNPEGHVKISGIPVLKKTDFNQLPWNEVCYIISSACKDSSPVSKDGIADS